MEKGFIGVENATFNIHHIMIPMKRQKSTSRRILASPFPRGSL